MVTTPTVPTVSQTFSDTLAVGGTNTHTFNVSQPGPVTVTLTSITPQTTVFVGLAAGSVNAGTCLLSQTSAVSTQAGTTPQISGTASVAGTFCLQIFDIGNLAASNSYSITVSHP